MFGFCGFVVLMEMLREHPYSQCAGSAYFLVKMGLDEPEHPICFRLRHARNISLLLDGVLKIPKWGLYSTVLAHHQKHDRSRVHESV